MEAGLERWQAEVRKRILVSVGLRHYGRAGGIWYEVTLARLGPGNFFGEISLLDGGPRTATVRANTDTTLLCLGRGGHGEEAHRERDDAHGFSPEKRFSTQQGA